MRPLAREYGDGKPLDIAGEMNAVTLDVIGRTMFGADFTGPVGPRRG